MKPTFAPMARPAIIVPSMTECGSCRKIRWSLQVPGSLSSPFTNTYFGFSLCLGTKDHFMPVGNPAPPRPRRFEAFICAMIQSGPCSIACRTDVNQYPASLQPYRDQLHLRSMLVKRAAMFPVECVVRGYLFGSGWKEYQKTGSVCGVALLPGMVESERLPEPLFTPATKAELGDHDINISMREMGERIGAENAN